MAGCITALMDYLDTSALIKGYLVEPGTVAFMAWFAERADAFVSPLTVVEFKCAITRRQRTGLLTARRARTIFDRFESHLADESIGRLGWRDQAFVRGVELIDRVGLVPLRALDALHLAIALQHRCNGFATADRVQADAAARLGFAVQTFFPPA